jgi:hypothetical protein
MTKRVPDEQREILLGLAQSGGELVPLCVQSILLDLRDASVEIARLKAEIHEEGGWREERDLLRRRCDALEVELARLKVVLESAQAALAEVIREHTLSEEAHQRIAAENLGDMLRLKADRRALCEKAVRAGMEAGARHAIAYDKAGGDIAPLDLGAVAARVLAEYEAEKEPCQHDWLPSTEGGVRCRHCGGKP